MRGGSSIFVTLIGLAFIIGWAEDNKEFFVAIWDLLLVIIPIITIFGFIYLVYDHKKYLKVIYDKPIWFGGMFCNKCFYRWQSRRDTAPRKCAGCGSTKIEQVFSYEKAVKKFERSTLTDDDLVEAKRLKIDNSYPSWLFAATIFTAFEIAYFLAVYIV